MEFSRQLSTSLQQLAQQRLHELVIETPLTEQQSRQLATVVALSDFVFENFQRHSDWLSEVLEAVNQSNRDKQYSNLLHAKLADVTDEPSLHKQLRLFRRKESVIIAWRDLLNLVDVTESLRQISALAESIILQTYHWLYRAQTEKSGEPLDSAGQPMHIQILGMGKLGGGELNFSSDVDLIFSYPHKGVIDTGRKPLEYQQFFTKVSQKLIAALNQHNADGFVYRIDMRLRPFGNSGPVVVHFDALEDYYQSQGREWERYAMVKARVLGAPTNATEQLQSLLAPFVFRRYLDFSALESLRKMKQLINQEIRRRGLTNNIKLGKGGIREVEFIAQTFQLIRGGREPTLRSKSLLTTLSAIAKLELLPESEVAELRTAYLFLRRLEHGIQQLNDQQTQTLPDADIDQQRIAYVMGFVDYQALLNELDQQMQRVNQQFVQLIHEQESELQSNESPFVELWLSDLAEQESVTYLQQYLAPAEPYFKQMLDFKQSLEKKRIGQRGKDILDKLFPYILEQSFSYPEPTELLKRVIPLLLQIATRTTYLELLWEHPGACKQLLTLCQASPWIADYLAKFPILLDELLDPQLLLSTTPLEDYPNLLQQFLLRIPEEDMEAQMDALRQFKQIHQLRIAAADISGVLPIMKVSDHLTSLAECICARVIQLAWQQMGERYGFPKTAQADQPDFAIIGYGKLGGLELGYGSDLDLVFLYSGDSRSETNGVKAISTRQFYVKMAQRMIHIFNTRTSSGQLYEVDMRLRPSGESGLLVSHIDSFSGYLLEDAWTWEHQALTRARVVYAPNHLKTQFDKIRYQILSLQREPEELMAQVSEMRRKMRQHLDKSDQQQFDIKQGKGGIADIEFVTQYLLLANAYKTPAITEWSDNIRSQQALTRASLLTEQERDTLADLYQKLRNHSHRAALAKSSNQIEQSELVSERQQVMEIWQKYLGKLES